MRRRAVHRVYAEEEEPLGFPEEPGWRSPRRGRAVAIVLLAAGVVFVAALAIHALGGPGAVPGGRGASGTEWAGSQATSEAASHRVRTRPRSGEAVPHRAHRPRMGRRAVGVLPRQAQPRRSLANAARVQVRAVAYPSTARAAPVVAGGAAESEFSFER